MTAHPPSRYLAAFSRAIWDTDLVGVRICLSFAEFFWAVMLLWPGTTFDRPTYSIMARVAPEEAWALVLLLSSATQMSIVLLEDFSSTFSRYFAAWNASLWGFVIVAMSLSVYPPPAAIGGEIALAFAAMWVCIRPYLLAEGLRDAAKHSTT